MSANLTPFTLLYFTKEIGRLMTQERVIKQAGMDENHTLMAKTKGRRQNLKAKLKSGSMKISKKRKRKQHIHAKNRTGQK